MPQRNTNARTNKHNNKQRTTPNSPPSSVSTSPSPSSSPSPSLPWATGTASNDHADDSNDQQLLIDLRSTPSPAPLAGVTVTPPGSGPAPAQLTTPARALHVPSDTPGSDVADLLALEPLEVGFGALSFEAAGRGGGEGELDAEIEAEDMQSTYRSPPFRQLSLPLHDAEAEAEKDGSPPPLPVLHRQQVSGSDPDSVSGGETQREGVSVRPSFPPHPHPSASPSPLSVAPTTMTAMSATMSAFRTGSTPGPSASADFVSPSSSKSSTKTKTKTFHDEDNDADHSSSVTPAPSPAVLGGLSAYMRGGGAGTGTGTGMATATAAAALPPQMMMPVTPSVGVGVRASPTPPLVSRPAVGLGVFSGGSGSGSSSGSGGGLAGAGAAGRVVGGSGGGERGGGAGGAGKTQHQPQVHPPSRPHPHPRPEREKQEFERDYEREYARPVGGPDDGHGYGYGYGHVQSQSQSQSQGRATRGGRDHDREHAHAHAHSHAQGSRGRGEGDERGYGHDEPLPDERYGYGYNNYGGGYGDGHSLAQARPHPPAYGYGTGDGYDRRGGRREEGYGYGYGYGYGAGGAGGAGSGAARGGRGVDDRSRERQQLKEKEARERERETKHRERERKARANCVLWAKWDLVDDRRILTLAYPSSLQIWDTSDLRSVKEVLNVHIDSEEWQKVLGAGLSLGLGVTVTPNQDQDRGRSKGRAMRGEEKREGRGDGFWDVRVVDAKVLPLPPSARRRRSGVGVGGGGGRAKDRDRVQDRDQFEDVRPLLGILLETTEERYSTSSADDDYGSPGGGKPTGWEMDMETERKTFLVLYSLLTHQVVVAKSLVFNTTGDGVDAGYGDGGARAEMMAVSGDVIVLSTSNPPTLHVFSASTLEVLYVIPSSALEAFVHPSPHPPPSPGTGLGSNLIALSPSTSSSSGLPPTVSPVPSHGKSTSASGISLSIANAITNTLSSAAGLTLSKSSGQAERMTGYGPHQDHEQQQTFFSSAYAYEAYPRPVFALSGRLLAYASTSPAVAGSTSSAGSSPVSLSVDQSSPTPSSLMSNLSNLSRGMGSRIGIGATKMGRPSSSSGASASGFSPGGNGGSSSVSSSSSPFGGAGGNNGGLGKITGMTQADVGQAALKVGESVFSGMKFLGGMAYDAARSRVSGGAGGGSGTASSGGSRERDSVRGRNVPVSRSVPDTPDADEVAARVLRERRYSSNMSNTSAVSAPALPSSSSPNTVGNANIAATTTTTVVTPHTKTLAEHGHYVTVIDLAPLFNANHMNNKLAPVPRKIDEFNASRSQPVAGLRFSQDGTSVSVLTRDGHSVKVFKLFPAPSVVTSLQSAASSSTSQTMSGVDDDQETEAALDRLRAHRSASQTYDLYRGRTSAVVEDVAWARDERWVALGTRNRTVHVFATNPYGGKSDLRSHLEGRVRGVDVIEYPLTALTALAKLRGSKNGVLAQGQAQGQIAAPLAFTFISPTDVLSSPDLVPPLSPNPSSSHSTSHSHPPSSPKTTHMGTDARRSKNFQDILLFDPATGVLSLRRLTLDKHPVREGVVAALGAGVGATRSRASVSMSLPGSGGGGAGAGRLSSSPRMGAGVGPGVSAGPGPGGMRSEEQKQQARQEVQMELGAKESVMATWDLRRASDRAEVRVPVRGHDHSLRSGGGAGQRGGKRDTLSQGELTTSSPSPLVLPRSLYLSHQFAFYTLGEGEDYHALIRRYQFEGVAILGRRIEVRRGVEVSVGGVGSPQKTASGGNAGILIPGGRSLGSAGDDAFVEEFPSSPQSHPHPRHSRSLSHSHALSHSHSHRHSIQQVSSSFDEPIASAISGTFFDFDDPNANTLLHPSHPHSPPDMNLNLPPILPMYPNGVPGLTGGGPPSKQKAVAAASMIRNVISNAIPIRGMGMKGMDGVRSRYKAGLGSNTRVGRVKKDREEDEGEGVPLEFDEEDEDFVGSADPSVEASTATIVPVAPANRQHQALNPDLAFDSLEGGDVVGSVDEDIWNEEIEGEGGWDTQDREAVEEQEGFWDFVGGGKSGVGGATTTTTTGIGLGGSKLLAAGGGTGGVDSESGPNVKDGGSGTASTSVSTGKGTNPKRSGNSKQKQAQRRV